MANINEERLRKFKEMGLPAPMAPIDPSSVQGPIRNTDFAAKLAAIKSGGKRQELNTFIAKSTPASEFQPLPLPTKSAPINENRAPIPELKTPAASGPSFDLYEKALYGNTDPYSDDFVRPSSAPPIRGYSANIEPSDNDTGTNFLDNIKQRLAEKASRAQHAQGQNRQVITESNPQRNISNGDVELKNYISEISTDVCKKMIKQFMSEYLSTESGIIRESDKIKKAEVVREDIVKIDGRFFKLTPVQIKKK